VSTPGHRNVVTLEAVTRQASRWLSTTSTTVDNHFPFDNFELILFSDNLSTKCFQFTTKSRIKLYFLTINRQDTMCTDDKFKSTRVDVVNASTSREKSDGCKPGDTYIHTYIHTLITPWIIKTNKYTVIGRAQLDHTGSMTTYVCPR